VYRQDLFDASTAQALCNELVATLEGMTSEP
jgi:hypothetical protein